MTQRGANALPAIFRVVADQFWHMMQLGAKAIPAIFYVVVDESNVYGHLGPTMAREAAVCKIVYQRP